MGSNRRCTGRSDARRSVTPAVLAGVVSWVDEPVGVSGGSFNVALCHFQQLLDLVLDTLLELGSAHHLQAGAVLQRELLHDAHPYAHDLDARDNGFELDVRGSGSFSASFLTSSRWKRGSSRTRLSNISATASPTSSCARRLRRRIARAASASSSQST